MSNTKNNPIQKKEVRVRIAPSPTGIPHIGNTRTALFNFLFARHNGGKFLLRIEDTDQKRIVPGAKEAILEILTWLGLAVDEQYVESSDRLELYKKASQFLLERGYARKDEGAVRFIVPKNADTIAWQDAIGAKLITFKTADIEDFVILKSDGFPTYHLASVVDDWDMKISHVIRGEEWISSTPKHLLLYKALGFTPPVFVHLPVILGPDKSKLSKRHGAKSVLDYRDEGYLKEAILNYMALLGWNPGGDREVMSLSEMIQLFDLKDINTANPIFDAIKLEWMNGVYIRKSQKSKVKSQIYEFYNRKYSEEIIEKTIPLIQDRIKTLADYFPLCEFFFNDPINFEVDLSNKKDILKEIFKVISKIDNWEAEEIGNRMQMLAKDLKIKPGDFFMLLRVSVTGKKISPPLNESMEILGKETVIGRLSKLAV